MDTVIKNNNVLSCLSSEDQKDLLQIGVAVNSLFRLHGDVIWHQLNTLIPELIKPLEFQSIINQLPPPQNYHRISVAAAQDSIDVVFLLFKVDKNDGAAVLINTYGSHDPNDRIFDTNAIINNIVTKDGHILRQTPVHSHKVICHSCVAWVTDNVIVSEQFYQLKDNKELHLTKNILHGLHDCGYDNTLGKVIHSIAVDFGPDR